MAVKNAKAVSVETSVAIAANFRRTHWLIGRTLPGPCHGQNSCTCRFQTRDALVVMHLPWKCHEPRHLPWKPVDFHGRPWQHTRKSKEVPGSLTWTCAQNSNNVQRWYFQALPLLLSSRHRTRTLFWCKGDHFLTLNATLYARPITRESWQLYLSSCNYY